MSFSLSRQLHPSVVALVDGVTEKAYNGEYVLSSAYPMAIVSYRIRHISASYGKRRFVVHFSPVPNQFDPALERLGGVDAPPVLVKTKGDIAKVRALLKEQANAAAKVRCLTVYE